MSTLTAGADLAWKLAASEATAGGHALIENALLLVGILSLETIDETPAHLTFAADVRRAVQDEARGVAEVLARCGLEAASLRGLLRDLAGRGGPERRSQTVSRSPACRETFYRAAMLSGPAGVSALDLMAALGEAPDAVVARALREGGASVERLREEARRAERERRAARAAGRAGAPGIDPAPARSPGESPVETGGAATPGLDGYGRDLTALAARGELGPVIGRRAELLQVLQILARGRNPVLVGEPGVGKTAIVEALAMRAAQGKDPAVLGGKRIVELRLPALLAGAKDRGAFEERASRVLAEARSRPDLIVVMDELHMFVGAGETEGGGGNVGDPLKVGLARGDLRLIGATTTAGYREHIESDLSLARLFEAVPVDEPSREETLEILTGLRPRSETRHQVAIDDEALLAAIELSVRFDPDHNLPSKAIDLVDSAVARTRAPLLAMVRPPSAETNAPGESSLVSAGGAPERVTERAVAQAQSERSRLPLDLMAEGLGGLRRSPVLDVEPFLRERILGQDRAIARIGRRLRLALAGPRDPERPLATLLFLGPDGVGKTETARLAASFLFGSEKALHHLDHSAFTEEHLVSLLRTMPEAIVLLDEIEKAHSQALDLLVQLCVAGGLRDGKGRAADARHAIFVFTSSLLPGEDRGRAAGETDGPADGAALEAARRFFPPPFLNRIDDVIVFRALGPEDAVAILRARLRVLCEAVERQHGVRLEVEPEAEDFIARTGFDPACGVRELPRVVERLVEAPISSLILDGKIRKHAAWRVAYDEGGIYVVPRGR